MIGSQQARIIGILRNEFEKDPKSFMTIKEVIRHFENTFPNTTAPNYKTIATILKRLADNSKVDFYEQNNRWYYRYKNIESEVTKSLLKIFIQAFGSSGLSHLSQTTKELSKEDIDNLIKDFES
jgi:predicted transcriptional regulator